MSNESTSVSELIAELSQPAAYPFEVSSVEVCQTHISVVFLAGPFAYKVKKPVRLPFLDFSTLERRRHFCDEEVRINQRWAPDVYLGVVPISQREGRLVVEADGPIIEWAVKMRRLPEAATIVVRLQAGLLSPSEVERFAERLARCHADAARNGQAARFGSFDAVACAMRDNLSAAQQQVDHTLTSNVCERLGRETERALDEHRDRISDRATNGFVRELHGDLHLDHVYLFPERAPPHDVVIVDAIEFNAAFRWIDVVADMAFSVMDFIFQGRQDLARQFVEAYFRRTQDEAGHCLLPLYTAYRAAVRAKVEGIMASESEVDSRQRAQAAERARAHWLIALGELAPANERPALVLVSGLPGTGKSTVARALADAANFRLIRSDVVRKEIASRTSTLANGITAASYQQGIYSPDWTERTYSECLRQADVELRDGGRVIVDATFLHDLFRQRFVNLAVALGVPLVWLECEAPAEVARQRLDARQGDASDANWSIYLRVAPQREPPSELTQRWRHRLATDGTRDAVTEQALTILRDDGLA